MVERKFVDSPAVREATPLLIGLIGPSGTGKTFSALRVATGIQRVTGGEIFYIDSEARRALHYADRFKFRHVPFGAPFSPLDYLAAFEHCAEKGARIIIADSMSHEHESVGGVLDMHDAELDRLAGNDEGKRHRMDQLAWQKPKKQRRTLITWLLQQSIDFVFCFRAKEKMLIKKGQDPISLGFMPIAGPDYVYEMTLKCLLLPGADGVPTWSPENVGEKMMIKLPDQFRAEPYRSMLNKQLSEETGEALARWAAGTAAVAPATYAELVKRYEACSDSATLRGLGDVVRASWSKLSKAERDDVRKLVEDAKKRIAGPPGDEEKRTLREPGEDD